MPAKTTLDGVLVSDRRTIISITTRGSGDKLDIAKTHGEELGKIIQQVLENVERGNKELEPFYKRALAFLTVHENFRTIFEEEKDNFAERDITFLFKILPSEKFAEQLEALKELSDEELSKRSVKVINAKKRLAENADVLLTILRISHKFSKLLFVEKRVKFKSRIPYTSLQSKERGKYFSASIVLYGGNTGLDTSVVVSIANPMLLIDIIEGKANRRALLYDLAITLKNAEKEVLSQLEFENHPFTKGFPEVSKELRGKILKRADRVFDILLGASK